MAIRTAYGITRQLVFHFDFLRVLILKLKLLGRFAIPNTTSYIIIRSAAYAAIVTRTVFPPSMTGRWRSQSSRWILSEVGGSVGVRGVGGWFAKRDSCLGPRTFKGITFKIYIEKY